MKASHSLQRGARGSSPAGFALVVILAFVALLAVLVLAYFSTTTLQREVSSSNANQIKVDLFSRGAINTIVRDLRQEIAAGSTVTNLVSSSTTNTIYYPKTSDVAIPAVSGGFTRANGLENLLKISKNGQAFYSGTNYDTAIYPAASRAVDSSSSNASKNGRSISSARWNAPLLLGRANSSSTSDFTPVSTFVAPDWILVNRGGGNPTAWSTNMRWSGNASDTNVVVGRYAYAIYDEGGLLDANVAGYPTSLAKSATTFKNALSYADLTQIGLTTSQVDQLVSWRNYATLKGGSDANSFADFVNQGRSQLLRVANTSLYNNQSDRRFVGRQNLIDFFKKVLGGKSNASTLNALQYLGTFSRGLNQPSYVPATFASTNPAPKVNIRSAGGNSVVTTGGVDGTQQINPAFLGVRVATSFTRNNGRTGKVGEPLVAQRFAINRLAWLTYAGPIAQSSSSYNSSLAGSYVSTLKSTYGFTDEFLLQGTAENIYKYFGLVWRNVTDPIDGSSKPMWVYNHKTLSAPSGLSSADKIKALSNKPLSTSETDSVVAANRDPDFFELLKAAVNVGSIAKAAAGSSSSGWILAQYNRDISVDFAIIQMGANLIDQYDLDGYPTTIYFDDGAASGTYGSYQTKQFHGVENLPYLYRLRMAILKASLPVPFGTSPHTYRTDAYDNAPAMTQTGIGALLQLPEIWNPHDWNSSNTSQSAGIVAPTDLRIFTVADSGAWYNSVGENAAQSAAYAGGKSSGTATTDTAMDTGGANAWFRDQFSDGTTINSPQIWTVTRDSSIMTFNMSASAFREPTVLYMAGKYGLSSQGITSAIAGKLSPSGRSLLIGSGGFKSGIVDPAGVGASSSQEYTGFCVGLVPLRWVAKWGSGTSAAAKCYSLIYTRSDFNFQQVVYLQYKDASGNWITYDEKYANNPFVNPNQRSTMSSAGQSFFDAGTAQAVAGTWSSSVIDPRSNRFGMPVRNTTNSQFGWNSDSPIKGGNAWQGTGSSDIWVDGANGVVQTMRQDASAGTTVSTDWDFFPYDSGWYPGSNTANGGIVNANQIGRSGVRPGLLTQNNPDYLNDGKLTAAGGSASNGNFTSSPGAQYQFYADPDGVVRRAMGAFFSGSGMYGLPMATANTYSGGAASRAAQSASRPVVLNRPFRSVADMGHAFSGTPWRNVDFGTPESGSAALLDVFCLSETEDAGGLVAGTVNLNTRQTPVLQAILTGAYKDIWNVGVGSDGLSTSVASGIANSLVARTSKSTINGQAAPSDAQPLGNIAELVGKWKSAFDVSAPGAQASNKTQGSKSYTGFSGDAGITTALGSSDSALLRYRETPIRALGNAGQTRVWNLMVDLVGQTGRYISSSSGLSDFVVEGEQRQWVHLAIDRFTGEILDSQIEVAKE